VFLTFVPKIKHKPNMSKKSVLLLLAVCLSAAASFAQAPVDALLEETTKKDKEKSDKAITDEKVAVKAATWSERAKIYETIAQRYIKLDSSAATKSLEAYNKVVELDKDKKGGPGKLAKEAQEALKGKPMFQSFLIAGDAYYKNKNYPKAYANLLQASDLDAKDTTAAYYGGYAALGTQDSTYYPKAAQMFERYVNNGGKTADYYTLLVQIYRSYLKQPDKAIAIIDKGLAMFPNNKDLSGERVNILLAQGRTEEAIAGMKGLVEKNPNDSQTLANLGILYDSSAGKIGNEMRKLTDEMKKGTSLKKRVANEKGILETFTSEAARLSAGIKKAPKNVADLKRQLADVQARLNDQKKTVADAEAELKAEEAKAVDAAANEKRIAELKPKQNEQKNLARDYYMKSVGVEAGNYDANFGLGAYYYNEAALLNGELSQMGADDYKTKGSEVEGRVCGLFKKALVYFEKAKATKSDFDLDENISNTKNFIKQYEDRKVVCVEVK
jgi:Tetratricopeptide repeat